MTDLTALTEITAPTTDDLVYVVDAPSGAKNPRKCSIANLVDARTKTLTNTTLNSSTNTVHADATQTYARNSSGSTITKGSPVYISGFDVGTTNPEISLADASVSGTMPCIGLVSADIANNATGAVIASGQLTTLNTSTYSVGDTLYVSETTGTLTATKPTGTALIQNIAIVERVHSSFGVVHISAINRSNDLPNIPDGKLWIGNSSAVPTDVTLSGDVTVTNSGVTAIGATKVTNAMLAGSIANTKLTTDPLDYANMTAPVASVAFNSQKLTGLADGVADSDAATKGQVDVAQAGLDAKYSCKVATTANITLSGEQTIDGVLTSTDRVLVKNQTSGAENGIYVSASGAWARSADANTSVEVTSGLYTLITEGTVSAGQGFVLVTADPITLDTTALTFSQFSGVGDLIGGTGITKSGNTISVDASQTQITAIGTLTAGVLTGATGLPATTGLTATGTKDATTFLRGDDTWAVVDASPLTTKGDVYTFDTGNQRLAVGADGLVLKADSSTATGLAWGSGGGGATIVHTYTNTTDTTYLGTASSFGTVGVGDRDIYIKKIDANNEGVFTKIWKNGAAVEVQIA